MLCVEFLIENIIKKNSVGGIFADKPLNRGKLLIKPRIHGKDNRYGVLVENIIFYYQILNVSK